MFNRLIIAVLTLGLLLTFCSAAISSDSDVPKTVGQDTRFGQINPNADRFQDLSVIETSTPAFSKPPSALEALPTPTAVLPPTYFCEFIDYSNGASAYFWRSPDAYGDYEQGVRFTSTEGYTCTLLAAYIAIYGSQQGLNVGAPDMLVTVYADDGFGLPGTALGSVVVPNASLPTSGASYVPVDLSTIDGGNPLTFVDGEEFHIGAQVDNWMDGDTLFFLSDDGTQSEDVRAWENWGGTYYTMLDDWGGNYTFLMGVDLCCDRIPFTDCYTQEYDCGPAYFWKQPDAYGDDYFNMRFSVGGPETLTAVGVAMYAPATVGTPDLDIFVWGDDGTGYPDLGNVIYSTTIPNASILYYPSYNVIDLSSLNLVMMDDFHVGWSTNGGAADTLGCLSDDGSCGTGRSSEYYGGAFSSMLADWGADVNFLMFADLCRDEFSQCKVLAYNCGLALFWRLPDRYGDTGDYQKFTPAGEGCRLEYVDFYLYWASSEAALPLYTENSEARIYLADGGSDLPGTLLDTKTILPADYGMAGPGLGIMTVDYTADNFTFDQDIWIGLESLAPDTLSGIRTLSDDGSCGQLRSAENWSGSFYYMLDDWGTDYNFVYEAWVCCVPVEERVCNGGEDWATLGMDMSRTGASYGGLGDMQTDLTKDWQYDATQVMAYASPVNFGDTLVGYFLDHVVALDMNTGAEIWTRIADGFEIGSGAFATPTIVDMAAYGDDRRYVFVAGGDTKAFNALDLTDGSTIWTRNFLTHSNHFMTFGPSVVVECGGTPIVVYSDDNGSVYAVEVLTGNLYAGWTVNPVVLPGAVNNSISASGDGSLIFAGTLDEGGDGNFYAINACDGTAAWDLATSAGLQMAILDADGTSPEEFYGPASYDAKDLTSSTVFVTSDYSPDSPTYNSGGVQYSINANDGSLNWAALASQSTYGYSAIDAGQIISIGWTPWVPGYGTLRGPIGFNKGNGSNTFKNTGTNPGLHEHWMMSGVLSCEPEVPDMYIAQSYHNYVSFFRSSDGASMFHRRWSDGVNTAGHRTPLMMVDGQLIVTFRNKLVSLTPDVARPRLDIPKYTIAVPVEFGSPDHTNVTFPNVIGNMGGAPLTVNSVTLTDTDNGTVGPSLASINIIGSETISNMEKVAGKFAKNSDAFRASFKDDDVLAGTESSVTRSNAAFALPSWVYGIVSPAPGTVIPPQAAYNDSSAYIDIVIDIDGTQVPRGLTSFYAEIDTDDPDYFLDDGAPVPAVNLRIVGGCLFPEDPGDSQYELHFGMAGDNWWYIWNTPMLGVGDLGNSAIIDGDDGTMWQGSYIFTAPQIGDVPNGKPAGIFSSRVFHWADNWSSATPGTWMSLLPDPNCYDATCPPNHRTNVFLGEISNDMGATYESIFGEVTAYAFVDSAQDMCNYDTLGNCISWDWSNVFGGAVVNYEDSLTVGFHGCVEVIGAIDQPQLTNFIVHRFDLTGRYGQVTDLQFGAFVDYDLAYPLYNDIQVNGYDEEISTAWVYNCNQETVDDGYAWGMVKIPFGCGYESMVNSHTVSADGGGWNDTVVWLDSVNYWMETYTGLSHQQAPNLINPITCSVDPSDREAMFTLANDLTLPQDGNGTYTIAVANFGYAEVPFLDGDVSSADFFRTMANTANKWCGFGRGDVNNDNVIDLVDIAYMIDYVYYGGNGPYPFEHLGDVNNDAAIDGADVTYMIDYYFNFGACMQGDWVLGGFQP